jgi:hypothetical protein
MKTFLTLIVLLACCAPFTGARALEQDERVDVKVRTPAGEIQYQKGTEPPPPQTKVFVERQPQPVVVQEAPPPKKGCSCSYETDATPLQGVSGLLLFAALGSLGLAGIRVQRARELARGTSGPRRIPHDLHEM